MTFKERIRKYFKDKGMTNRDVCLAMGNYSEQLYSRQISAPELSGALLVSLIKYFPDIDLNYLLKEEENILEENSSKYKLRGEELIEEIEERLIELKVIMSRK
jgi:hypothetical protein